LRGNTRNRGGVGDAEIAGQAKLAAAAVLDRRSDAELVAGEEAGDVDDQPALARLGGDVAYPKGRISEAVAHARLLGRGGAGGAKAAILDLGDDLAADPAEDDDLAVAGEAPVEADRRRAQPGFERGDIDEPPGDPLRVGRGQRQQDAPLPPVHVDGQQALLRDRALEHLRGRIDGESGGGGGEQEAGEEKLHGHGH
jgi:hypothetical protein